MSDTHVSDTHVSQACSKGESEKGVFQVQAGDQLRGRKSWQVGPE